MMEYSKENTAFLARQFSGQRAQGILLQVERKRMAGRAGDGRLPTVLKEAACHEGADLIGRQEGFPADCGRSAFWIAHMEPENRAGGCGDAVGNCEVRRRHGRCGVVSAKRKDQGLPPTFHGHRQKLKEVIRRGEDAECGVRTGQPEKRLSLCTGLTFNTGAGGGERFGSVPNFERDGLAVDNQRGSIGALPVAKPIPSRRGSGLRFKHPGEQYGREDRERRSNPAKPSLHSSPFVQIR